MRDRVFYRCVIGSQAYGLAEPTSDIDRRGIYLPRAEQHWSLEGVPEQIDDQAQQEFYWELERFLVLALKANPHVIECLYSPIVELATPLARELLAIRECFLSQRVLPTFTGFANSQWKDATDRSKRSGSYGKPLMHMLRLLIVGIGILRDGEAVLDMSPHRERLLAVKRGDISWTEVEAWRESLLGEIHVAAALGRLAEEPDTTRVNAFLIEARRKGTRDELP